MGDILPHLSGLPKARDLKDAWGNLVTWSKGVVLSHTISWTYEGAGGLSVTATSEGTAVDVGDSVAVVNPQVNAQFSLDFTCPSAVGPAAPNTMTFVVFEDTGAGPTAIGQIAKLGSGVQAPVSARFVRSIGLSDAGKSFTWSVGVFVSGGTGTVYGDMGGAGKMAPIVFTVNFVGA